MSYMLVELSTGNVLGFFATEHEALREVAESIKEDGIASIDTLGLGYNDPTGPVRKIADGAELAQRALEEVDRKGLNVMEGADHKVAVLPSTARIAASRTDTVAAVGVEELQHLSSLFKAQAVDLQNALRVLQAQTTNSAWRGSSAERFRREWKAYRRALSSLSDTLDQASEELRQQMAAAAADLDHR